MLLDRRQRPKNLRQIGWLVDFPIFLRRETNARPVSPAALVTAAECCSRRPGRRDQLGDGKSGCEDLGLQSSNILLPDQFMIHGGNGVLPQQRLRRNERAKIPRNGSQVAVRQLEPSLGERVRECPRVLVEALRNL